MTTEIETKKFSFKKFAITLTGIAIVLGLVSYFNLEQAGNFSSSSYEQQIVNIRVNMMFKAANDENYNISSDLYDWLTINTLNKSKILEIKENLIKNRIKIDTEYHIIDGLIKYQL